MLVSAPVLAAIRVYLYCTTDAGDPTIDLWSSLMFAQLHLLAAQVFLTSGVLSKKLNAITTNFGSANRRIAPVPSVTYRLENLSGGDRVERQPGSVSLAWHPNCEDGGDGESERGILVTRSYFVNQ
jgi:hypothetical protein